MSRSFPSLAAILGPDELVRRQIVRLLAQHAVPRLARLEVEVARGRVVLRGPVDGSYERQLAVAIARQAPGVVRVSDEIVVAASAAQAGDAHHAAN